MPNIQRVCQLVAGPRGCSFQATAPVERSGQLFFGAGKVARNSRSVILGGLLKGTWMSAGQVFLVYYIGFAVSLGVFLGIWGKDADGQFAAFFAACIWPIMLPATLIRYVVRGLCNLALLWTAAYKERSALATEDRRLHRLEQHARQKEINRIVEEEL